MPKPNCDICGGSGMLDVLNVWSMQREYIQHGELSIDSSDALPMLKQAVRCPECYGSDAHNSDMDELKSKMGGDQFKEETFKNDVQ